jgi:hypothetical protein
MIAVELSELTDGGSILRNARMTSHTLRRRGERNLIAGVWILMAEEAGKLRGGMGFVTERDRLLGRSRGYGRSRCGLWWRRLCCAE